MNHFKKPSGPRCAGCGRIFQPRVMRDGTLSQTCGQTACVALNNRKKSMAHENSIRPRVPNKAS